MMGLGVVPNFSITEKIKAPRPQDKQYSSKDSKPSHHNHGCQTIYRESEAQTEPWTPPYKVLQSKTPEVLTLACLSFHNGLQVSKHDIEVLYRLRKKREWDRYLTYIYNPQNEEFRLKIINEIERSEWEFREKEIQEINELRMELAHQQLMEQRMIIQERMIYRMKRARERCEIQKRDKLPKIKANCERDLRRVQQKQLGINKVRKLNIIDRFTHPSSDLCASFAMLGNNPAYAHEKLCIDPRPNVMGDIYNALWKSISTNLPSQMVVRGSKKHCCKTLKYIPLPLEIPEERIEQYDRLSKKVEDIIKKPHKCVLGERDEKEEEFLRNIILLQSLIKGRAVQSMVLRSMEAHRDLAHELKSTTLLNPKDKEKKLKIRRDILTGMRDFNIAMRRKGSVIGVIEKLEGHTISTVLDYTSKALVRLEDEKRAHLFALMAERERWAREFTEAGRRQQEEIRLRQHEEIYKQVLKMHEITSDIFLEQTLDKQVKATSKSLATVWAEQHAKDVDDVVDLSQLEEFEKVEHIAKLSNQYLMDQVEKNRIRDELKCKTDVLRRYAEEAIYGKKDELVPAENASDHSGNSMMRLLDKDDKQDKEWDEFYDEMLKNSPELQLALADNVDKIPLYEDPSLAVSLFGNDQIDDVTLKHEKTFIVKEDRPQDVEANVFKEKEVAGQEIEVKTERIHKVAPEKKSSASSSDSSVLSEIKKFDKIEESSSQESIASSNVYKYMDQDDLKVLEEYISDPLVSSEVALSSSELCESSVERISPKEKELAEKRKKRFEKEEQERFLKNMASKLVEQITSKAEAVMRKIQELKKDRKGLSIAEGKADALVQAYNIVSQALMKCSANLTEECLRGSLKPWLNTILGEAEKRVFELFDAMYQGDVAPKEDPEVEFVQEKVEEPDNTIEDITGPSQERLPFIREVNTRARIFKEPLYTCPEVRYSDEPPRRRAIIKLLQETENVGEELEQEIYGGVLLEHKIDSLPDESCIEKPLTVIKSRRDYKY